MSRAIALALLVAGAGAGCATVDVYRYAPRPLPPELTPRAAIRASLYHLADVSWRTKRRFAPTVRAQVVLDETALVARATTLHGVPLPPLRVEYRDVPRRVRAVTHSERDWIVLLADAPGADVEIRFRNARGARLFLDGATYLR